MILRRLADSIRRQDWFTVVLEVLIVVLGVFIGIEVANWNAAMADERLGADYQERLAVDLRKDLDLLRGLASYYDAVLESVSRTRQLLDQPGPDPETLLTTAYRATEINYNPQTRATWDQIVSSGHIGLLPREAAAYLAEYFAFDFSRMVYDQMAVSDYRRRVRSLVPVEVQQAIRGGCSDLRNETGVIVGFMPDCDLGLDGATVAEVAQRLKDDPELRTTLNFQYSHAYTAAANHRGVIVLIEQALDALGNPVHRRQAESEAQ